MGFVFGNINTALKLKDQDQVLSDICLHSKNTGNEKHVVFLVEAPLDKPRLHALTVWIGQHLPDFDFDIVNSSVMKITNEQIKKEGIFRFYKKKRTDFQRFIREDKSLVVAMGFSISAITLSSDLNIECFYDYVFNKTYFYAPQTCSYVFPIDGFDRLFKMDRFWRPQDHSRMQFAQMQMQILRREYEKLKSPPLVERLQIVKINSKAEFVQMLDEHEKDVEVAWDIETSGLDYILDRIGCLTMAFSENKGYFIPWENVDIEALDYFFNTTNRIQIGQNLKFDVKFLRQNGVPHAKIDFDTLQAGSHVNEMRFNGLKSLAYYYTQHGGYDYNLDEFIDRYHPATYLDIPEHILCPYATKDAILNFQVYWRLHGQVHQIDLKFPARGQQKNFSELLYGIRMPAVNDFIDIEMDGVCIDQKKWDENATKVEEVIAEIKGKLREELGLREKEGPKFSLEMMFEDDDIFEEEDMLFEDTISRQTDRRMLSYNTSERKDTLQSTLILGKLLEEKGWECFGRAKKGHYLTGDDQLTRWEQQGHKEATTLKNLRSWLILQKTFIGKKSNHDVGWRRYVRVHGDGTLRIHPTYKSMLMDTLRNGCGDPNYQQVPSHSLGADYFKKIFTTPDPKKYYLVTMDYSSFQMRLAAIDSEDPVLFNEYKKNPYVDMHSKTAYNVFCKDSAFDLEEVEIIDGGVVRVYFAHEEIEVLRDGAKVKVPARDLVETDVLVTKDKK